VQIYETGHKSAHTRRAPYTLALLSDFICLNRICPPDESEPKQLSHKRHRAKNNSRGTLFEVLESDESAVARKLKAAFFSRAYNFHVTNLGWNHRKLNHYFIIESERRLGTRDETMIVKREKRYFMFIFT
jgi:hypothetical protein